MANFKQRPFSSFRPVLPALSLHLFFSLSPLFLCSTLPLFSVLHLSRLHRLLTGWLCSVSIRPAGCSSNACGGSSCSGSLQWQVSGVSWTLFYHNCYFCVTTSCQYRYIKNIKILWKYCEQQGLSHAPASWGYISNVSKLLQKNQA